MSATNPPFSAEAERLGLAAVRAENARVTQKAANTYSLDALGRALRAYRAEHDLSLREVARLVGVSYAHLSDIEHGRRYSQRVALWLLQQYHAAAGKI